MNSPAYFSPWNSKLQALGVLLLCLASRLYTTVFYIEDPDSLRFALGMIDYDVTQLQPQFPGYPAFIFPARFLYALTGSYAVAFSLLGGLGLFVLIHYALSFLRWRAADARGIGLILLFFFSPMLWLLGNRYMSDLSGAACMFAAFHHLSRIDSRRHLLGGFFLTGLLAGWRLSYLPFLLVPLVLAGIRTDRRLEKIAAGLAGILIWLVPFIAVTGWDALWETARDQSTGHFQDFGGTYRTEPDWLLRAQRMFAAVWTDGLAGWWSGRHPVTLLSSAGILLLLFRGLRGFRRWPIRESGNPRNLLAASFLVYAIWIFFFQNVVNQTRHMLPLVPPLLMLAAAGMPEHWQIWRARKIRRPAFSRTTAMKAAVLLFFAAYAAVGTMLALQHKKPTAAAQAETWLESFVEPEWIVITSPWGVKYLSAQGLKANFVAAEFPGRFDALPRLDPSAPVVTVGNYADSLERPVLETKTFYHNPYVNRLVPRLHVVRYGPVP